MFSISFALNTFQGNLRLSQSFCYSASMGPIDPTRPDGSIRIFLHVDKSLTTYNPALARQ